MREEGGSKMVQWGTLAIPPIIFTTMMALIEVLVPDQEILKSWCVPLVGIFVGWVGLCFSIEARNAAESARDASNSAKNASERMFKGVSLHQKVVPMLTQACEEIKSIAQKLNIGDDVSTEVSNMNFLLSDIIASMESLDRNETSQKLIGIRTMLSRNGLTAEQANSSYLNIMRVKASLEVDFTSFDRQQGRGEQ